MASSCELTAAERNSESCATSTAGAGAGASAPESRDLLYERLKVNGIYARRYFYPLIPDFEAYRTQDSDLIEEFPRARLASQQVLCLPL